MLVLYQVGGDDAWIAQRVGVLQYAWVRAYVLAFHYHAYLYGRSSDLFVTDTDAFIRGMRACIAGRLLRL